MFLILVIVCFQNIVVQSFYSIYELILFMSQPEMAIDMKQRYIGHCNTGTDIKQASFVGQRGMLMTIHETFLFMLICKVNPLIMCKERRITCYSACTTFLY